MGLNWLDWRWRHELVNELKLCVGRNCCKWSEVFDIVDIEIEIDDMNWKMRFLLVLFFFNWGFKWGITSSLLDYANSYLFDVDIYSRY